jgi:hypothetical protein
MHGLYALAGFTLGAYALWYWTFGAGRGMTIRNKPRTSWDRFMGQQRSEVVPKKGWWQATDGKWYPPHQHPNHRLPPPPRRKR